MSSGSASLLDESCRSYVGDIMDVVRELQGAIDDSGRPYEATTEQIAKMTDAESQYVGWVPVRPHC